MNVAVVLGVVALLILGLFAAAFFYTEEAAFTQLPGDPGDLARRLEELEKKVSALEERVRKLESQTEGTPYALPTESSG
jgi:hypothetical protein